jgi:hypothetical protein
MERTSGGDEGSGGKAMKQRPMKVRCFFDRCVMKATGIHRKGEVRVECPVCHIRAWTQPEEKR